MMNRIPLIVFFTTLFSVVGLFYMYPIPNSNTDKVVATPDIGLRVENITIEECIRYFSQNGGYFVLYTPEFKFQLIREDNEVRLSSTQPQLKPQVMAPGFALSVDGFNISNEKDPLHSIILLARGGTVLSQQWATAIDRHLWRNQEGEIAITLSFESGIATSYIVYTAEEVQRLDEMS